MLPDVPVLAVAAVPSPRIVESAAADKASGVLLVLPLTPRTVLPAMEARLVSGMVGSCATANAINPTAPLESVPKIWFAVWPVARVQERLPEDVTGDPVAQNVEGKVRPTDVTLPVPGGAPTKAQVPLMHW